MRTRMMIMLIVLGLLLAGVGVVVAVISVLGASLGTTVVLTAMLLAALVFAGFVKPWYRRWGATGEEIDVAMPGDELIEGSQAVTRAIEIEARPEDVWP